MNFGVQLSVAKSAGPFLPGIRYHFAGNVSDGSVLIVWFSPRPKVWRTHCLGLPRQTFESYLIGPSPVLMPLKRQHELPEWLKDVEGLNFDDLDRQRTGKSCITYRAQVEKRLAAITPAAAGLETVLTAPKPLKKLNEFAYEDKSMHANRFQTWFFSYVLYQSNIWALKQPTHNNGCWARDGEAFEEKKFGRDTVNEQTCTTYSAIRIRERCGKAYLKYCGLGVYMSRIYRDAMIKDFGCRVTDESVRNAKLYHPDKKPFPSLGQFRYAVEKLFGCDQIHKTLYGAPRVRQKAKSEKGMLTARYANNLEGFEVDAYYVKELPRCVTGDGPSQPLAVARGVCVASGAIPGIGFAFGKENAEAYRAMLFCMAVPKSYIARIYGLDPVVLAKWIMEGLPPGHDSDRGPAGKRKLVDDLEFQFPMKAIKPSYQGQSKAPVEASHPRDMKTEGAPSFVQSDSDSIELIKREILRTVADNGSSDISNRLTDEQIHDFLQEDRVATPQHLWEYNDLRCRTCAYSMTLQQAVRAFWTPIKIHVDRYGPVFRGRSYTSESLKATGIVDELMRRHRKIADRVLQGYILSAVMRYVWVEVNGELVELEAVHRVRVDGAELNVPLSEMEATAKARRELRAKTKVVGVAEQTLVEKRYEEQTGKGWNDGGRKSGRPVRGEAAADEARALKGKSALKKAA